MATWDIIGGWREVKGPLPCVTNLSPVQKGFFSFLQGESPCLHQCFVLMTFWCWFCHQKVHGEEENSRCIVHPEWQRVRLAGTFVPQPPDSPLVCPQFVADPLPHTLASPAVVARQLWKDSWQAKQALWLSVSPWQTIVPIHDIKTTYFICAKPGFKCHVAATKPSTAILKDVSVSQKSSYLVLLALRTQ